MTNAQTNRAKTQNGAETNATSENAVVDFFFIVGASRSMTESDIENKFLSAWSQNPELAVRVGLWSRDPRGGAGERRAFRIIFKKLIEIDPDRARRALARIPELGRWDDVLVALETPLADTAVAMIKAALESSDRLCAKWMPRQGLRARRLRESLGWSPKRWRKTLVNLTQVVETQMCRKEWDEIDYESVPSVAHARYRSAFSRHSTERYAEFLAEVRAGEKTINASAVFPHDVIRNMSDGCDEQWAALPDFMSESKESIMPLVDVSGSMAIQLSGKVTALDVAVGLGLYVSERNEGPFRNAFITFSSSPQINITSGSIRDRVSQMVSSDWDMGTNVMSAIKLILDTARHHNLDADSVPNTLLILSDMEFDFANSGSTTFESMQAIFEEYGYRFPRIVWWNLNSSKNNYPVAAHENGTAMISGFSPAILKAVLAGRTTPLETMMETINSSRYDF
jgi:hypothetical protein